MKMAIWAIYWGFVGYQIHAKEVDVKVLRKLNDGFDALARRNAQIWSEEIETTRLGIGNNVGGNASGSLSTLTGNA